MRKPDDKKMDYASVPQRKKIIFIRHGESEWNRVFNKGFGPSFLLRLTRAVLREMSVFFKQDSVFMDSPLSAHGIQQAWDLLTFLTSQREGCQTPGSALRPAREMDVADIVAVIRGDAGNSIIVSSILRRSLSTALLGLSTRLLRSPPDDMVLSMTSLQEISRNVDTLALTPAKKIPKPPILEMTMENVGDVIPHFYESRINPRMNNGNKTLQFVALKRQDAFIKWVFEQHAETIIVSGHSLWFREFFKSYLPKAAVHVAKTNKIVNCGVVAFDFFQSDAKVLRINPDSIKVIYGGFEDKKGKAH